MMAFIGVRISWLMLARKCPFDRLAASAASLARTNSCCIATASVVSSRMLTKPVTRPLGPKIGEITICPGNWLPSLRRLFNSPRQELPANTIFANCGNSCCRSAGASSLSTGKFTSSLAAYPVSFSSCALTHSILPWVLEIATAIGLTSSAVPIMLYLAVAVATRRRPTTTCNSSRPTAARTTNTTNNAPQRSLPVTNTLALFNETACHCPAGSCHSTIFLSTTYRTPSSSTEGSSSPNGNTWGVAPSNRRPNWRSFRISSKRAASKGGVMRSNQSWRVLANTTPWGESSKVLAPAKRSN